MTRRERVLAELKTALETITVVNGYNTDAGANVYVDRTVFNENDTMPMLNINEDKDSVLETSANSAGAKVKLNLPISVEGFNTCDPLAPSPTGHALISDVKKCIFSYTFSAEIKHIAYVSSSIEQHENGSGLVATTVDIDIVYIETIGNPED